MHRSTGNDYLVPRGEVGWQMEGCDAMLCQYLLPPPFIFATVAQRRHKGVVMLLPLPFLDMGKKKRG
jgi:hypothetical protein